MWNFEIGNENGTYTQYEPKEWMDLVITEELEIARRRTKRKGTYTKRNEPYEKERIRNAKCSNFKHKMHNERNRNGMSKGNEPYGKERI